MVRPHDGLWLRLLILPESLDEFMAQLVQVQEVEIDLAQPRYQRRIGAKILQPGGEVIGPMTIAPMRLVDMIEERAQRQPRQGLGESGGSRDALTRVEGYQPRADEVQLQARPAGMR